MRILVISDIHLEFGPFGFPTLMPDFDVMVFAGDIGKPVAKAVQWIAEQQVDHFKGRPAIYVAGNHEFYGTELKSNLIEGSAAAETFGVHFLSRNTVVLNGVRFIGCILWTDYRLYGTPKPSMVHAGQTINDHRLIRYKEATVTIVGSCLGTLPSNIGWIWHSLNRNWLTDLTALLWSSRTTRRTRNRLLLNTGAARLRPRSLQTSAMSSNNFNRSSGFTVTITPHMIIWSGGPAFLRIRRATPIAMATERTAGLIRAASSNCSGR